MQTGFVVSARFALPLTVVALVACGEDTGGARTAPPQRIHVGIRELDGRGGSGFVVTVRTLVLTRAGWAVDASVRNATTTSWLIGRPHSSAGTKFGLYVGRSPGELRPSSLERHVRTTPSLLADRFDPPLPRILRPNGSWSGRYSGRGSIAARSYVAFAFGRFLTDRPPPGFPRRLIVVTSHAIRVPGGASGKLSP